MNDEDDTITRGKTFLGRSFEFSKGRWKIYTDDNEVFDGEEAPVINIGKNPEAEG